MPQPCEICQKIAFLTQDSAPRALSLQPPELREINYCPGASWAVGLLEHGVDGDTGLSF